MIFPSWSWNGDWGWLAGFLGTIILLAILCVPWFFFLLNLHNLLRRVDSRNRAMPSGHVWLNFIPVFNLGWFLYTVIKIRDSVAAEYRSRGWEPEGDQGYNVGLVTGVLAIASFFLGWVPVLGWGIGIAELVCWILYWLKTSEIKNLLGEPSAWTYGRSGNSQGRPGPASSAGAAGPPPYAQRAGAEQTRPSPPPRPPATAPTPPPPPPQSRPTTDAPVVTGESEAAAGGPEQVQRKTCAACGSEYLPGDKYCRTCGLRLP